MKILLAIGCLFCLTSAAQVSQKETTAYSTLAQIGKKLSGLQSVSYEIDRKILCVGENYRAQSGGKIYLEFPDRSTNTPLRFQLFEKEHTVVYNGKHYFVLDSLKKEINLNTKPGTEVLLSSSALYNSLFTLRTVIPILMSSSRVRISQSDTNINNKNYLCINILLNNRYIGNTGILEEFTSEYIGDTLKPYLLIVDATTLLPHQFITRYNEKGRENDHATVTFTSIEQNVRIRNDRSWYYSSFLSSYSPRKERVVINNLGKKISGKSLSYYKSESEPTAIFPISPNKLTVMEFWIKNCGYCMLAFPKMQRFQDLYGKEIEFVSVNTEDSVEDIAFFYRKHNPSYKMLYDGRQFAEQLGIESFPTVIIVDKEGIVQYSGGFDEKELEKEINKLLKKKP